MEPQAYIFDAFTLDVGSNTVREGDEIIDLPERAIRLLVELVSHAGKVLDKNHLLQAVWPEALVEASNLRVQIANVRKALRDGVGDRQFVVNVPGRGYMFVRPVRQVRLGFEDTASSGTANGEMYVPSAAKAIGREDVVEQLVAELATRPLLSLIGAGGIGKSTVAAMVAERGGGMFGEVISVDLSSAYDRPTVMNAIARRLGVEDIVAEAKKAIVDRLCRRSMLLVLDNCEHIVDSAAEMVEAILDGAAAVRVLQTSREPLRIENERIFRLSPLATPPEDVSYAEARAFPAFQLFCEEAKIDPVGLTEEKARVVSRICRRLDGLPLAIELVAAEAAARGLEAVGERIDVNFALTAEGLKTILPRHKTMTATLDWSFGLLSTSTRIIAPRLTVFAGTFTFVDAIQVCLLPEEDEAELDDTIFELVSKNLLVTEFDGPRVGYRFLQTTRHYLSLKFRAAMERNAVTTAHVETWRQELAQARDLWKSLAPDQWRSKFGVRVDDLRATILDCFTSPLLEPLGVDLVIESAPLWFQMSRIDEFRSLASEALSKTVAAEPGPAFERKEMRLNLLLGHLILHTEGVTKEAIAAWTRALALAEHGGAPVDIAQAAAANWMGAYAQGDYERMICMADLYYTAASAEGNPGADTIADRMHAEALHFLGRHRESAALAEKVLSAPRGAVDYGYNSGHTFNPEISMLTTLARVAWLSGDAAKATSLVDEGISLAMADGGALTVAYILAVGAGPIAYWSRDWELLAARMATLKQHAQKHSLGFWQAWGDAFERVADWNLAGRHPADRPCFPDQLTPLFPAQLAESLAFGGDGDFTSGVAVRRALSGQAPWCQAEIIRLAAGRAWREGG